MAATRLTRTALQAGDLPLVDVRTGEPADGLASATPTSTPAWPWALLLLVAVSPPLGLAAMVVGFAAAFVLADGDPTLRTVIARVGVGLCSCTLGLRTLADAVADQLLTRA